MPGNQPERTEDSQFCFSSRNTAGVYIQEQDVSLGMQTVQPETETGDARGTECKTTRPVSEECLVIRNYDGDESYTIDVQFLDAADEVAYSRTVTVGPLEAITFGTRLRRGVYRVEASLEMGEQADASCLIGSGPHETALVETGNRTISVVEGFH